jgi:glycosyltransferase involved in cell wall biosynthesis
MYKFSVIMPAFNRAQFLPRAVTSVLRQDCIPLGTLELIVVDDGSQDDTPAVISRMVDAEHVQSLKYIRIPHVGEPGTVRNVALQKATGEYLAYCDSDDYWLPHHLATAEAFFKRDPELGMVANHWSMAHFWVENGTVKTKIVVAPHPMWAVNTNCRVHRRTCIDKIGLFNTSKWGEDADFFTRIENNFKCHKTGIVTSVNGYIKQGNNLTFQFDAGVKRQYF